MEVNIDRVIVCAVLALAVLTSSILSDEKKNETVEDENQWLLKDCAAENSIKEMLAKLEYELSRHSFCPNKEDSTYIPRPCIDMSSDQSVMSQVCDRITALDIQVNKLASKINPRNSNHNSGGEEIDKPYTQIRHLKEEIKRLRRSSSFYATWKEKLGNSTQHKLENYIATVNSGAFDTQHGVFNSPFDGVYHFSFSYEKKPEVSLDASLLVDDVVVASSSQETQPKIDILTSLTKDQKVTTSLTTNSIPEEIEISVAFSGYFIG